MQKSFSIKFYLGKYHPPKDKYKIYIRLIISREQAEIALPHWITQKEWDDNKQRAIKDKRLNEELSHIEGKLYEIRRDLTFQKKRINAKIIKDIFTDKHLQSPLLITYLDNHVSYLKQSSEHTPSTVENYEWTCYIYLDMKLRVIYSLSGDRFKY